jgi:hypothetical protein
MVKVVVVRVAVGVALRQSMAKAVLVAKMVA